MANVTVTITVKADGEKIAKRKIAQEVRSINSGGELRDRVHAEVNKLASELRNKYA